MIKRIKTITYSAIAAIIALILAFVPCANAADMIDVSNWQTGINVTTSGAQIVVTKATEGIGYVNPDCDRVVQSALAAGNCRPSSQPTLAPNSPCTNMLQQRQDGQDYVIGYDSLDPGSMFQPWPNTTPYLLDKFVQQKTQVTNEVLGYLGIQSSGTEKKERLISDEVAQAQ